MTWTDLMQRLGPPAFILWSVALGFVWLRRSPRRHPGETRLSIRGRAFHAGYLVLAALAVAAVPFLIRVIPIIRYPYQLEHGEGYIIRAAWLLSHGHMLYGPWQNPVGGIDALYPPVYFAILAALFRFFEPVVLYGRLITLAAALGILFIIGRIVWRRTASVMATVAAILFPLTFGLAGGGAGVNFYFLVARTDALGVFFALAGAMVAADAIRAQGKLTGPPLRWTALLLLLGTLCKQNFVAAAVAVFLFMLIRREVRPAIHFAAWYAAGLSAVTALLSMATAGRYFFLIYRLQARAPLDRAMLAANLSTLNAVVLLLAAAGIALFLRRRQPDIQLLLIYTAVSSALAVATGSKSAALANHFLEPACLFAVGFGLAFYAMIEPSTKGRDTAFALLLVTGCLWMSVAQRAGTLLIPDLDQKQIATEALLRKLQRMPGPHLTSDPYLSYLGGQPENCVEWYIQRTMLPLTKPYQAAFLEDLSRGKYTAIEMLQGQSADAGPNFRLGMFTFAQADVVQQHYRPLSRQEYLPDELAAYDVYVLLVPCQSGCGVPVGVPAQAPSSAPGPYRRILRWLMRHAHHA